MLRIFTEIPSKGIFSLDDTILILSELPNNLNPTNYLQYLLLNNKGYTAGHLRTYDGKSYQLLHMRLYTMTKDELLLANHIKDIINVETK